MLKPKNVISSGMGINLILASNHLFNDYRLDAKKLILKSGLKSYLFAPVKHKTNLFSPSILGMNLVTTAFRQV
jgi:hypothetical protein